MDLVLSHISCEQQEAVALAELLVQVNSDEGFELLVESVEYELEVNGDAVAGGISFKEDIV